MDSEMIHVAFEEWCQNSGEFTDWSKMGPSFLEYQKPRVNICWKAWQAATHHAELTNKVFEASQNKLIGDLESQLTAANEEIERLNKIISRAFGAAHGAELGLKEVRKILEGLEANQYPECSGDPNNCPENEGFGCCEHEANQ